MFNFNSGRTTIHAKFEFVSRVTLRRLYLLVRNNHVNTDILYIYVCIYIYIRLDTLLLLDDTNIQMAWKRGMQTEGKSGRVHRGR